MLKIAGDAWRTVLTQTIKIFVLSRVTPKQFRATPGLSPTPAGRLTWRDQLFQRPGDPLSVSPALRRRVPRRSLGDRVLNFGADLEDGLVFYALLIRHWPALVDAEMR